MANQKNTSFVFLKRFFQRFLCIHVKMIGRLIQDQQIRVPVDQLTKSYLCLFTTTQYPYLALKDVYKRQASISAFTLSSFV